jgi:hypothetical protein
MAGDFLGLTCPLGLRGCCIEGSLVPRCGQPLVTSGQMSGEQVFSGMQSEVSLVGQNHIITCTCAFPFGLECKQESRFMQGLRLARAKVTARSFPPVRDREMCCRGWQEVDLDPKTTPSWSHEADKFKIYG